MYKAYYKNSKEIYKSFNTLYECKMWFQNLCNIPSNWTVECPDGKILAGQTYQEW